MDPDPGHEYFFEIYRFFFNKRRIFKYILFFRFFFKIKLNEPFRDKDIFNNLSCQQWRTGGLDFENNKFRFTAVGPTQMRIQGANHLPKIWVDILPIRSSISHIFADPEPRSQRIKRK